MTVNTTCALFVEVVTVNDAAWFLQFNGRCWTTDRDYWFHLMTQDLFDIEKTAMYRRKNSVSVTLSQKMTRIRTKRWWRSCCLCRLATARGLQNGVQMNGVQNGVLNWRTIAWTAFNTLGMNDAMNGVQKIRERINERPFFGTYLTWLINISIVSIF